MNILYEPGIQIPGIYTKAVVAHIFKESHIRMLILAGLFIIVKKMELLLMSITIGWINYIYAKVHQPAVKMN